MVNLGKLVEAATAVVSVSDFGVRFLQQRFPEHAARFHRIYNGIDLTRFCPADFAASIALIISVGRLIEKKGFSDLIETLAAVAIFAAKLSARDRSRRSCTDKLDCRVWIKSSR